MFRTVEEGRAAPGYLFSQAEETERKHVFVRRPFDCFDAGMAFRQHCQTDALGLDDEFVFLSWT